jgi:hypothetical protein
MPTVNNSARRLTATMVRELLDYDPESGLFTWKWRDRKWLRWRFATNLASGLISDQLSHLQNCNSALNFGSE